MANKERLRSIPAVEKLLNHPKVRELEGFVPRSLAARAVREVLAEARRELAEGREPDLSPGLLAEKCKNRALSLNLPAMRRVINATGVVLHTNLGRAPLSQPAVEAMREAAGYVNLEYDIEKGGRGHRHDLVAEILCELTGAEAALVVNNNAAAVLLTLAALAKGGEVVVSRGEMVEVGGAFRIPEVMAQSGAVLREVGATNKTRAADYEAAIGPQTALLMKVHTSNYRVMGFTEEVSLEEMVALGKKHGVMVANDLGSGLFFGLGPLGGDAEPPVVEVVKAGADIVTFSGDKLLGGPQAGIIVGTKQAVAALRNHPLMRALRPDKVTLAALEATLRLYRDPQRAKEEIPVLRMLLASDERLKADAEALAQAIKAVIPATAKVRVAKDFSEAGGGSLPLARFPTHVVSVSLPSGGISRVEEKLRLGDPPIIARVKESALVLDPRTLCAGEGIIIAQALAAAL